MGKVPCKSLFILFYVLTFLALLPLSGVAKERKEPVVVLPITAPTMEKNLRSFLTDSLISQLIKSEKYEFISGKLVNDAMRAAFKKQAEEGKEFCDETACIREVAENFGTDLVLSSKIVSDEKTFFINIKIDDISTGAQVGLVDDECLRCSNSEIRKKLRSMALILMGLQQPKAPNATASSAPSERKPPAQVPSSGKGDIFIESDPSEAMVYLDGVRKDRTPLELKDVPAGWHTIQLKKGKVYKGGFELNLEADDFVKRQVQLERAKGKIKITSAPTGASIIIDGKDTGMKTPDVISTEAGDHDLKLQVEGKVYEGKISVDPERRVVEHITRFEEIGIGGMVLIKGGCFQMGDTFGGGNDDEKPVHEVCVADYYMSDHEVTQGEWKAVMGGNPSKFSNCGDDCPVENVSWNDIQDYIQKLNQKEGRKNRLPTEAEWEYAARSGGKKEKWAGTNSESSLNNYAWYSKNSGNSTHSVKTKRPNGLGLYDMSGNVWEWVSDWYGKKYYKSSDRMNPQGPSSGSDRVVRGGSWDYYPGSLRASDRSDDSPDNGGSPLGFRLARTY